MPPLSCVFLDAAGTLFHLRERVGATYARFAARQGLPLDPAELDLRFRQAWRSCPPPLHPPGQLPGDDDRSWWRELVKRTVEHPGARLPEDAFEAFFAEVYEFYGRPEPWTLFEDALPALERLRARHRLFVVSNFDRRLHGILQGLGLADFFEAVILSSEEGASKPHPRMFQAALKAAGVPAHACLHIGDDRRCDLEGAQALGLHARLLRRPEISLLTLAEEIVKNSH